MKCMKRWLGIMMAVILALGSLQIPVYAVETGATAVEGAPDTESAESTNYIGDHSEDEPAADTADDGITEEADPVEDAEPEEAEEPAPENTGIADETQDQPEDNGQTSSDDEDAEQGTVPADMPEESADQQMPPTDTADTDVSRDTGVEPAPADELT